MASNITQYAYHRLLTEGETEPPAPSAPGTSGVGGAGIGELSGGEQSAGANPGGDGAGGPSNAIPQLPASTGDRRWRGVSAGAGGANSGGDSAADLLTQLRSELPSLGRAQCVLFALMFYAITKLMTIQMTNAWVSLQTLYKNFTDG